MSYAVMPLDDYVSTCDKVREKVGDKLVLFEDKGFGYLVSEPFLVEAGKMYTLNAEFSDNASYNDFVITGVGWKGDTSPWISEVTLPYTFTGYETLGCCVYLSTYNGLTANDIISASIECDGEIIIDFVEPKKIKSGELADKVDEVYEAGRNDFGYKGSAKGNLATLNYVHPIEHIVKVNLSSAEITDFSEVKVKANGKNLFEAINKLKKIDPTKTYFLSSGETTNPNEPRCAFRLYDVDGNSLGNTYDISIYGFYWAGTRWYRSSNATKLNHKTEFKGADRDKISYIAWQQMPYENVQFEIGTTATEYEPYQETEYTANADGTVDNVKSISPTMNISTDTAGVIITAECFKDAQKEIESLTTAIALTGGN